MKVIVRCEEVGCWQEVDSIAVVKRRRNLCDPSVLSYIEEPGPGPGKMTGNMFCCVLTVVFYRQANGRTQQTSEVPYETHVTIQN